MELGYGNAANRKSATLRSQILSMFKFLPRRNPSYLFIDESSLNSGF